MFRRCSSVFALGWALLMIDVSFAERIEAVDDNFIRGGQPDTVQLFSGDLLVKKSASIDFARKAYVKFDLDGCNPDGSKAAEFLIRSAISPTADFTVNVFGLIYDPAPGWQTNWSESALTWNNAPANLDTISGIDLGKASLIGTISPELGALAGEEYSVTLPALGSWLQTDNTVTIVLIVENQTSVSPSMAWASSEHFSFVGPEIEFSRIPEPSTLTLLLFLPIGLVFLGLRRSRRRRTV